MIVNNAWRARIGLISPTARGKGFAFWYKNAPEGVEIIPTFIGFRQSTPETFEAGFKRAEELAEELKSYGCNLVVVSGTPPFLLRGPEFEREWGERLAERLDIHVITAMAPHVVAARAMGISSVAIATYYGDELNQAIVDYFGYYGIRGHILGGFADGGGGQSLYTTTLQALDDVSREQVYQYCKRGWEQLSEPVDALYINGGGWDAAPAVEHLEQDLETKVVFAQAAHLWFIYKTLKISNRVDELGMLVRGNYQPAPLIAPVTTR
jgi:maleate cis-trans isomerase